MSNPAFIVDGQMEKKILQKICPNRPIKLLNCNGKNVSYEAAAKYAATHIRLLKNYYPIIIVFDRENRADSPDVVASSLYNAIIEHQIQNVEIHIGVPDCMTENWMLADITAINSYYSLEQPSPQECFESVNGKSRIRNIIGKYRYGETQDGPEIFSKCSIDKMYKNSQSFKAFINLIKTINCTWLEGFTPPIN